MALDERARHELFLRLEQVLGPERAETLMEMMPPVGWADVATKRDLDALEERMILRFDLMEQRFGVVDSQFGVVDQRFETLDHRFGLIDQRFDAVDQRFDAVEHRFDALDHRFDALDERFEGSEHKLIAAFRAELLAQSNVITGQTRTLLIANMGTVLSLAVLAFGIAKLT